MLTRTVASAVNYHFVVGKCAERAKGSICGFWLVVSEWGRYELTKKQPEGCSWISLEQPRPPPLFDWHSVQKPASGTCVFLGDGALGPESPGNPVPSFAWAEAPVPFLFSSTDFQDRRLWQRSVRRWSSYRRLKVVHALGDVFVNKQLMVRSCDFSMSAASRTYGSLYESIKICLLFNDQTQLRSSLAC